MSKIHPKEWAKDFFTRAPAYRNAEMLEIDFRQAIAQGFEEGKLIGAAIGYQRGKNEATKTFHEIIDASEK